MRALHSSNQLNTLAWIYGDWLIPTFWLPVIILLHVSAFSICIFFNLRPDSAPYPFLCKQSLCLISFPSKKQGTFIETMTQNISKEMIPLIVSIQISLSLTIQCSMPNFSLYTFLYLLHYANTPYSVKYYYSWDNSMQWASTIAQRYSPCIHFCKLWLSMYMFIRNSRFSVGKGLVKRFEQHLKRRKKLYIP